VIYVVLIFAVAVFLIQHQESQMFPGPDIWPVVIIDGSASPLGFEAYRIYFSCIFEVGERAIKSTPDAVFSAKKMRSA
jgi:hypothetical protein